MVYGVTLIAISSLQFVHNDVTFSPHRVKLIWTD